MPRWESQKNPEVQLLVGEPKEDEQAYHIIACNDYLRMGRGRSQSKLVEHYQKLIKIAADENAPAPNVPTKDKSGNVVARWSAQFDWVKRAELYDVMQEERRNLHAEEILNKGFALQHERVNILDELSRRLIAELDKRGLYGIKKKGILTEEGLEIVYEEEFRRGEIKEIRGLLDDIASEVGGRIHKNNVGATGLAGVLSGASNFHKDVEEAEWEPIEEGQETQGGDKPETSAELTLRDSDDDTWE